MGLSLREQLLQAGLIDANKAKQANKSQHHQRREQAKKPVDAPDPKQLAQQQAAAAKAARDLELNRQLQEKQDQKSRRAQVRQLVEQHRVERKVESEELYNFVDGKKVRRIPVDKTLRERLIAGQLAIVRHDGRYEIVPAEIGERIRERDAHALVSLQASKPEVDENDPYKDFVVPDDLTW